MKIRVENWWANNYEEYFGFTAVLMLVCIAMSAVILGGIGDHSNDPIKHTEALPSNIKQISKSQYWIKKDSLAVLDICKGGVNKELPEFSGYVVTCNADQSWNQSSTHYPPMPWPLWAICVGMGLGFFFLLVPLGIVSFYSIKLPKIKKKRGKDISAYEELVRYTDELEKKLKVGPYRAD